MKYTKEQLQAMSDKEINTALATLVFDKQGAPYTIRQTIALSKFDKLRQGCIADELYPHAIDVICGFGMRLDYCNNPNDIMPLAFERLVNTQWFMDSKEVRAYTHSGKSVTVSYQNCSRQQAALRAHAICLILVLQGEKE